MSRLVSDLIRSKVTADAIDEVAADNLVAMIHDALPADAGLDDIDHAIGKAREGFGPLFRKPEPSQAEAAPKADMRSKSHDRSAERVRVGTLSGNPWAPGSINRTRQAMVEAADPALAARLKAEAKH